MLIYYALESSLRDSLNLGLGESKLLARKGNTVSDRYTGIVTPSIICCNWKVNTWKKPKNSSHILVEPLRRSSATSVEPSCVFLEAQEAVTRLKKCLTIRAHKSILHVMTQSLKGPLRVFAIKYINSEFPLSVWYKYIGHKRSTSKRSVEVPITII